MRKKNPVRSVNLDAFKMLWQTHPEQIVQVYNHFHVGTIIFFPSKVIAEWNLVACVTPDVRGVRCDFKLKFACTVLCSK